MARGEVKWFNNAKGWGFIIPEGGGEDIFVHFSSIHGTGYKTLVPGQTVTYDIENGERGLHASNVIALTETTVEEMA
ncbi:cold-shock protein [Legionella worsleiensis]|uniref:Cold shock protein CspD n=1 Tax=Legionella worsleiensis TaxID=45076 RepID=A0A0W1AK30_9GAMM|nr:cold-shock protein [Legionella worsleiensis]KTD81707.1 cold shock protein CspD [Legionella worsleiensis]STY31883.1 cold shock protein CspD [Legionella worsleiensis]